MKSTLWKQIGSGHHHGIVIPLFSLHSEKSSGIGEFLDLIPLIKWCEEIGFDVIQLLPLNDTGHVTSPYSAITAFGLNPIYLSLSELPYLDLTPALKAKLADLRVLTKSQRINYAKVYAAKEAFLRDYYRRNAHLITHTKEFLNFIKNNSWLDTYALFKTLKVKNNYKIWEEWPEDEQNLTEDLAKTLSAMHHKEIDYHIFLQYLCFLQMGHVKKIADEHHVFLKGDIPILIGRDSADIWAHKDLFFMDYDAGSPKDAIFKKGQNWSFPIYNWEAHKKEGYKWWKDRLRVAENFYQIYRLDHIVGFYRIFAIPKGKSALKGAFFPKDPEEWLPQGKEILTALLKECKMFPIGENLPPDVGHSVGLSLKNFGVCCMGVLRWNLDEKGEYIDPKTYEPLGLITVSTHDHDTLTMWWENFPDEAKNFCRFMKWNYRYELSKKHLRQILKISHDAACFFHVNLLNEYLALVPHFTWPDPHDERVNYPGTISKRNWTYRFRPSVEAIVASAALKREMIGMLT